MNKEEALKQYKSLFPDNVEVIVLTKEDYDRQLGQLQFENIILRDRIQKAIEYIEWNLDVNEEVIEYINFDGNFKKVLDILKGSEENDK